MLRTTTISLATLLLTAAASPAQDDTEQKKEKTLEEAIDDATLRISERVNVVGSTSSLETIPGSAYVIEGDDGPQEVADLILKDGTVVPQVPLGNFAFVD